MVTRSGLDFCCPLGLGKPTVKHVNLMSSATLRWVQSQTEAWDFYHFLPTFTSLRRVCVWMHLIPSTADGTKLLKAVPLIAGLLGKRLSPQVSWCFKGYKRQGKNHTKVTQAVPKDIDSVSIACLCMSRQVDLFSTYPDPLSIEISISVRASKFPFCQC